LNEVKILAYLEEICDHFLCKTKFWKSGNQYYVATKFIKGYKTLEEVMDNIRPEPPAQTTNATNATNAELAQTIIHNLSHTLHQLHAVGVVHNDLKPGNVMVNMTLDAEEGTRGTCRIIDFDAARLWADKLTYGSTGTLVYLAPEKSTDLIKFSDLTKVDLWALGCIVVNLIATMQSIDDTVNEIVSSSLGDSLKIKQPALSDSIDQIEQFIEPFQHPNLTPAMFQKETDEWVDYIYGVSTNASFIISPNLQSFIKKLLMVDIDQRSLDLTLLEGDLITFLPKV
jgi:serine/threonine protein kinase